MEITATFLSLLQQFACVFTAPSFRTFVALMTGWCLSHRHRFVTELIQSSGSTRTGHHSRYHRFFSAAAWCLDTLFWVLAQLLVRTFAQHGLIELVIDDTLCRKRGLTLSGAGMHHDPLLSSRKHKQVSWGHDWVVLCLVIRCFWAPSKVWALPVGARLYRNRQGKTKGQQGNKKPKADPNHRTRPELAVELITQFAGWFADRAILVCGDSAYGGKSVLQHLPSNVDLISRAHPKAALYQPAPAPVPGQRGRRRKKGDRLPSMHEWADDATPWQPLRFARFGLHASLEVKTQQALYYKAGKDRLLTIVLVRDTTGQRPLQMFYCTRLNWAAVTILAKYSKRWAIEVTFENCKQLLGFEDPANRTTLAVQRTAPMACVLYSLIVLWFHRSGHHHVQFPDRPWYPHKSEPSFADQLSTLRRLSLQHNCATLLSLGGRIKKGLAQIIDFISRAV